MMEEHNDQFMTLRVGIFFDGTDDNTYSAKWGKQQLDKYESTWQQLYQKDEHCPGDYSQAQVNKFKVKELSTSCFERPDDVQGSSANNEITNIEKLYELYPNMQVNDELSTYYLSEYITGIGTGNSQQIEKADEYLVSKSFGEGRFGVTDKATYALGQLASDCREIAEQFANMSVKSFNCIQLDVFGFSRGAAAARHLINQLCAAGDNELKTQFTQLFESLNHEFNQPFDFDLSNPSSVQITFAGLFDTVAAIVDLKDFDFSAHNNDNGNIKLWLNPERVLCAVHLTANDHIEYRNNFSLNRLNDCEHFYEFIGPGAHSDIGGGYFSLCSYANPNYLLPRMEKQLIKRIDEQVSEDIAEIQKQRIAEKLAKVLVDEQEMGWNELDYEQQVEQKKLADGKQHFIGELSINRVVEGDLSRLYLRIMFGLACCYGVPLSEIKDDQIVWELSDYQVCDNLMTRDGSGTGNSFKSLCDELLTLAKAGDRQSLQAQLESDELKAQLMALALIHHSSSNSPANQPHIQRDDYQRSRYTTSMAQ
ncbi:phospholipase effector Tle1 domain-containing protein [Celerinatantimonas sp. MCCC 1A17872]|uniref:phospholipase effector Tle1 domain-containing protein n=1 Tax=Celerinatantimonas sp. MCCC 1A17872 TaxID=3177514 RepID=UPI0038BFD9EA